MTLLPEQIGMCSRPSVPCIKSLAICLASRRHTSSSAYHVGPQRPRLPPCLSTAGFAYCPRLIARDTGKLKDEDVLENLVDEKPVRRDMAFAVVGSWTRECVVAVCRRQFLAVGAFRDYRVNLGNVRSPSNCPLVVFLELIRPVDNIFFIHRFSSARASSRVYRGQFGSCAMRSPSLIAAMVSALGVCVPSMMKGMRFSRMTVLMYTVITEEAESPTSLQKSVKRSFVDGARWGVVSGDDDAWVVTGLCGIDAAVSPLDWLSIFVGADLRIGNNGMDYDTLIPENPG